MGEPFTMKTSRIWHGDYAGYEGTAATVLKETPSESQSVSRMTPGRSRKTRREPRLPAKQIEPLRAPQCRPRSLGQDQVTLRPAARGQALLTQDSLQAHQAATRPASTAFTSPLIFVNLKSLNAEPSTAGCPRKVGDMEAARAQEPRQMVQSDHRRPCSMRAGIL